MLTLDAQIEAVLFFSGESVSKIKLIEIFEKKLEEIEEALEKLRIRLEGGGIILLSKDNEVSLGTSPEISDIIESIRKEEINKEKQLSKHFFTNHVTH